MAVDETRVTFFPFLYLSLLAFGTTIFAFASYKLIVDHAEPIFTYTFPIATLIWAGWVFVLRRVVIVLEPDRKRLFYSRGCCLNPALKPQEIDLSDLKLLVYERKLFRISGGSRQYLRVYAKFFGERQFDLFPTSTAHQAMKRKAIHMARLLEKPCYFHEVDFDGNVMKSEILFVPTPNRKTPIETEEVK